MPQISSPALRGLYAVTPDRDDTDRLLAEVVAAVTGGCRIVQYRNKAANRALRQHQVALLANFCKRSGVTLIINDDLELAITAGAAGVHLGSDDGDIALARHRLGPDRLLGVSCYNDQQRVARALAAGADYVALGAMFPSATKPAAKSASLEVLHTVKASCPVPVATIGGITIDNAPTLIAGGADLVAVISNLFEAPDISARARAFQNLFSPEVSTRTA